MEKFESSIQNFIRSVPVLQEESYVKCDKCGCEITRCKQESHGFGPFVCVRETVTTNTVCHKSKTVLHDYPFDTRHRIDWDTFKYGEQKSDFDELEQFDLCDTCYKKI